MRIQQGRRFRPHLPSKWEKFIGDPKYHHLFIVYKDEAFSDLSVTFRGEVYSLHKNILQATDEYFRNMLKGHWNGLRTVEIRSMESVSVEAMNHYFLFLYTRQIEGLTVKTYFIELFCLADYFLNRELEILLVGQLEEEKLLTVDSFHELIVVYEKYSQYNLEMEKIFRTFITTHQIKIVCQILSPELQQYVEINED
jgi:hypothetical protein